MGKLQEKLRAWREDPVLFVRENFEIEPDDWQKDALMAFTKHQRHAYLASKGVGKTAVLSWIAWNFLITRPHPKVIATSISYDNLADGLWTEMALHMNKSKFIKAMFEWTKTRIFAKDHPETWFMSARTWSKGSDSSQQANTLAGIHSDYALFLCDEVGAYPDSVTAAAEAALATGIETKLVMAGNPTHLSGPLYRAATSEKHLWNVISINADPENPKRSPRVSLQWAQEQIDKWGRDNPFVMVNVLGRFPPSSINQLLGPDDVEDAMKRLVHRDSYEFIQKRIGVDVALGGDDSTVLFPRQGLQAFSPVEMRNAKPSEIAARVIHAKSKWGSEMEFIDDTGGFGSGVVDALNQSGAAPMPIHFAGKANDSRYLNIRAEMYFKMCDWIKNGGALPRHDRLVRELTAPTYTFVNGKFQIEPKEQIKKRLGFSVDFSDALALTFALPDMPSSTGPYVNQFANKMKVEFNPFRDED